MKPTPSAVSLLLTNLRLLEYGNDSEDPFPITLDVFASLKNKGKAFEHIVYHLLHTLNPGECAIRLEGCWPIYEPTQSRELRNIVFKWLTDLKKSGQIGGNILVRRTLLDDCSGERYEELLLSLSTAVLRDQIEKGGFQNANHKTFAYKQTSSAAPSAKVLTTLILAYKSSLARLLLSRRLSKSQWSSFNSFLHTKEVEIFTLSESLTQSTPDETLKVLPRGYEEEVIRKWQNNWLGDQRWLDILLRGDPEHMRDQFFELQFEKALAKHHHFKNGLVGVGNSEVSIRALEKQVQEQNSRLRELRQMREQALRTVPSLDVTASPRSKSEAETEIRAEKKDLRVVFDQHQHLHVGQLKIVDNYMANQRNEYTELMDSLRLDLVAVGIPSQHEVSAPPGYRHHSPPSKLPIQVEELCFSGDIVEMDSMDLDPMEIDHNELPEPELAIPEDSKYDYESDQEMAEPSSPFRGRCDPSTAPLIKLSQQIEYDPLPETASDGSYPENDDDENFSAFEGSIISDPPLNRVDPHLPLQGKSLARHSLGFGDDELLAEQIVSIMTATTFSPEKPSPVKYKHQHQQYQSPVDDSFDMDESTLKLSYQPQSAHHSLSENPSFSYSPRQSLSTPLRNRSPDRTRKEDLLVSSDYNSVFKSRPKIAVSPPFTPVGGSPGVLSDLSLVSGIQMTLEALSQGDMADFTAENTSSPLTKKCSQVD